MPSSRDAMVVDKAMRPAYPWAQHVHAYARRSGPDFFVLVLTTTAAPVTYSIPPAPPPAPADPRTAYNGMRMEQLRILAKLYPGHTPTAAEKAELAKEDGDEAKKK
ncbi:hypothetical protein HYPSUDRAFT_214600 [Hypholoma sublateritium FD-334 SS-4]|uniref:Uncharacterized protein n=1 Tax=Hypholoma sublateritium (strain FD-334 SS-4) TaxID=945553 RepID=A0A0D2PYC7_HYPSF|nr:hypothetical protein HYPSUDRAFT_214600 [Hypholoma sublateritium FD-334 SS-4]